MDKIKLGNTDIYVTPIGMGVLTIGHTQLHLPISEGASVIRYALERGINFLDTAEYYRTYPYIRRALDDLRPSFTQGILERPVIVSKSLSSGYKGMQRAIDACRKALNIDQVDIFLMHEIREAPDFEVHNGAWECLQESKEKGHVKAIGISTHHIDVVEQACDTPGMDVIFPLINMKSIGIRKGHEFGKKEEMAQAIQKASEKGIGVFGMKVLGGGNLIRSYGEALNYVRDLPGMDSIMIGMGREKDVNAAVAWAEGTLADDYTPDTSHKIMFVDRGDCEGCGVCVVRCTSKAIELDEFGIATVDNDKCVICGYCAPVCPTRALVYL